MSCMIIDGKKIAAEIRAEIQKRVSVLSGRKPGLAFILVGNDKASETYVRMKTRACDEVGFYSQNIVLDASITEEELLKQVYALNEDPKIDGILIQQPFPSGINTQKIIEAVSPDKDVDGFHPLNIGKMLLGDTSGFVSCTPLGIITLLDRTKISVEGKHVVIVGRSNIVGKPLAALLMQKAPNRNATVTVAHSKTENLKEICKSADILIAAMGKPKFITADMVADNAVVIDVGINRVDNTLVGDVDFDGAMPKASYITPVPGGVGPMTIATLLANTYTSFSRCNS